jgi:membrane peptidoglycan carboxypeptidase
VTRYAIAFEQHYSKDWILERYLNIAYFGDGAYGVQAAARHYFGTNAKDLTWLQGATLAGLVKNPSSYDPLRNPDHGLQRRNVVLDRLAQLHVIHQRKADKLKAAARAAPGGHPERLHQLQRAVLLRLRRSLSRAGPRARQDRHGAAQAALHRRPDDPHDDRPRFQRAADTSVSHHVHPADQAIGALAMIEPGTGDVKALAQSRPMGRDAASGQTFLNYTVPQKYGDSAGFQPGSTFRRSSWLPPSSRESRSRRRSPPHGGDDPDEPVPRLWWPSVHQHRYLGRAQLDHLRDHGRLHRHPGVGEHLLRQARAPD